MPDYSFCESSGGDTVSEVPSVNVGCALAASAGLWNIIGPLSAEDSYSSTSSLDCGMVTVT